MNEVSSSLEASDIFGLIFNSTECATFGLKI